MGLLKELETDSGVTVSYHKIESSNINWHTKEATFTVLSYINQEARINGKSPVERTDITLLRDEFPFTEESNVLKVLYEWFKQYAIGFEDAVNV